MKTGRWILLVLVLFVCACKKEESAVSPAQFRLINIYLSAFTFFKVLNPGLPLDVKGLLKDHQITLQLPSGLAAVNKLIASFESIGESSVYIGNTEQSSGETVNDFSVPVLYKVPAPDGSAKYYSIDVNPIFPELDQALEELMQQYQVPGLSVAIAKSGKLVYAKGYGYANKETHQLVDSESLFRVASLSKPITVIAILKLVQDGQLKLTDKVFGSAGILENDFGSVPAGSKIDAITVQDLLDHKSGWTNEPTDPMMATLTFSHSQLITDVVQNRPLTYAPGTHYYYSNFGYCVLGRVIEKVTGKSYAEFAQSDILLPADIGNMRIAQNLPHQSAINEVKYYQPDDNPYAYNMSRMDAHGGWLASATDIMRLMVRVDRNSTQSDLIAEDLLNHTYLGYYNWNHTGSFPGTSAILSRLNNEFSFTVLANTRNNAQPFQITDALNTVLTNQILTKANWPETDLFTKPIRVSETQ